MENDTAIWQIATWICGNFVPRESVKQEQDVERIILKIIIFAYCKFHVYPSVQTSILELLQNFEKGSMQ